MRIRRNYWTAALSCLGALTCHAQNVTQTITLQPGWNSVYLEVQPASNSTAAVFSSLPVASVWTRAERPSPVDFIQNPSEQAFNEPNWLGWFHPSRSEAFLGNLFVVQANRAYLIRSTNATPFVWNITGRPSLRNGEWVPDSYNLRGLPVDPTNPPTFLNFFRPSKAHYDVATGQLQKIYRLNASNQWVQVATNDAMKSGEAYWIYTKGASDYVAPLEVRVDLGDGLNYGTELTELNLRIANRTTSPVNALVRDLAGVTNGVLSDYQFNPTQGGQWSSLPQQLAVAAAPGVETRVRLAAQRQKLTASSFESVVEVRNGAGTRLLVPMRADSSISTPATAPLAGLWVGYATLNAVSEPHSANPTNTTTARSEFSLRLIIHVNAAGQARLLKEVLQMWRNGTYTTNADGDKIVDRPGQYVLLTDDSLIPFFSGATVRDGQSVGRRISTIGYDFPSTTTSNFLVLSGAFAIGQSLTGTLTLPYDHPNNPFKHKFHPDHDNLNPQFNGPAVESYTTTREIRLDFLASPPSGPPVPDFGYNEMGGNYRETVTGIHKRAIYVSGTFRLTRISPASQLNPSPTP